MTESAIFAAGCFWGVEECFRTLNGVLQTEVGYTGGDLPQPSYAAVCTGKTGHAEAVKVTFDPELVGYDELLQVFWDCHDPTSLNRQGPDVGEQYRSAIFCGSAQQRQQAEDSLERQRRSGRYRRPLVTTIETAGTFWRAEAEHQQYLSRRS